MKRDLLEKALISAMDRACKEPMVWGKDDCGLWCSNVIREALGYDPAANLRGRYKTQKGAHRAMGKGGLPASMRKAARKCGWKKIDPYLAQVGDMGLTTLNGIISTVICRSAGKFVGRNEHGISVIPADQVRMAFKVAPNRKPVKPEAGHSVSLPAVLTRPSMVPTSSAVHEPISAVIGLTALLEAAGVGGTLFGVSFTAGAIGGAIVSAGISIGLSYAASALLQRGNQPISSNIGAAPNDPSIRYNTRQPIPPKRIIYGTAQVGGALFFEQVINPFLYQGLMICDGEITRIRKIWIGTDELSFSSIDQNTILTPLGLSDQPAYNTHMSLSLRYGSDDQSIDTLIATDFPGLSGSMISAGAGTNIGNLTSGGGLASAFDGNLSQTFIQSAVGAGGVLGAGTSGGDTSGYIGKNYTGTPQQVTAATIVTPTDLFESGVVLIQYQISLYASQTVPANSTDGTLLGTTALFTPPPLPISSRITVSSSDIVTAWNYVWVQISIGVSNPFGAPAGYNLAVTECQFFAPPATPSQFRQRGIATAVFKYNFGTTQDEYTDLWGQTQRPNPIFLVDGIKVPDPRKSSHIVEYDPSDADAVAAARATWEWSDNAALCQAHYLTMPYGGKIDPRRIDWDKVARAADWDDGMISTTEGEFIKRGTINGLITLNQRPSDVLSSMLSANRGFILESAGKTWVSSGEPRTPVATIHDRVITGGMDYRASKPKRDVINTVKCRFVAEDREYQTVDGPVLTRSDLVTEDGESLEAVIEMPFTLDNRRAQYLQKAFLETARLGRRLSCVVDIEVLSMASDELIGQSVTVDSELFSQFNGTYFVESWGFTDNFGSISLSLSEYDPTIETDWDPSTDQQAFTVVDLDDA